jgi:hypothetical protein
MKITIENTSRLVDVQTSHGAVPARIWEGRTDSGIEVQVLVTRIAVAKTENAEQFERELLECAEPMIQPQAFPLRLIL